MADILGMAKRYLLGQVQNPLYDSSDPQSTPPFLPSNQAKPSPAAMPAQSSPPPSPTGAPPSAPSSVPSLTSPTPQPDAKAALFGQDGNNAPIPGAPVVPQHGKLAKVFLGIGEALGNPLATRIGERDREQSLKAQQYDANLPYTQNTANVAANQSQAELAKEGAQTAEAQSNIQKTQYEMGKEQQTAKANAISQIQQEVESGKYGDGQALLGRWRRIAQANPHLGMTDEDIQGAISSTHPLGSKYTVIKGENGRPEGLQDATGKQYGPDQIPNDSEAQTLWKSAVSGHAQARGEKREDEAYVAEKAAERQASSQTFQQTEQGRKAAAAYLADINDAKNQQDMIEKLTSGKMNAASQTAAMFKMIGLEQPTGTHRIMPAEVEGIEHLGGLSDRLKQKLLNWKEGDRFSPDLIPDVVSTAKILSQNKVKTANDNLQSTYRNTGYKVPGTGPNGRLDEVEQPSAPAQPANAAPSTGEGPTATGPNGHKIKVVGGKWVDAATGKPI